MSPTSWACCTLACLPLRTTDREPPVLRGTQQCWALGGGARPRLEGPRPPLSLPGLPLTHCPLAPGCSSPAAVLSFPTGVLEQLRSMVDDSEDTAPGLQPV